MEHKMDAMDLELQDMIDEENESGAGLAVLIMISVLIAAGLVTLLVTNLVR